MGKVVVLSYFAMVSLILCCAGSVGIIDDKTVKDALVVII